jgi:tetratricopeptide (TPR) repeat protein
MIDITKAKADAEEGLRIAADAESGPWWRVDFGGENGASCIMNEHFAITDGASGGEVSRSNGAFIADSRTRAPEAYRNVIALADENARLRASREEARLELAEFGRDVEHLTKERDEAIADYSRSIANREQDLAEFRALSARVTAAELAEEKMTRKAEEHYDRAVKAEAERDALRLDVVRLRSENEKHLEQSWAFETEIEQLREQLDKYVDVKFAKDVS